MANDVQACIILKENKWVCAYVCVCVCVCVCEDYHSLSAQTEADGGQTKRERDPVTQTRCESQRLSGLATPSEDRDLERRGLKRLFGLNSLSGIVGARGRGAEDGHFERSSCIFGG